MTPNIKAPHEIPKNGEKTFLPRLLRALRKDSIYRKLLSDKKLQNDVLRGITYQLVDLFGAGRRKDPKTIRYKALSGIQPIPANMLINKVSYEKAQLLGDKYKFIDMINRFELKGLRGPKQLLLENPKKSIEQNKQEIQSFFEKQGEEVFVKPLYACQGKGAKIIDSQKELESFLTSTQRPYIVQEVCDFKQDFRYIYLQSKSGDPLRICYEKKRPVVIGDGKSSLRELLLDSEIPDTAIGKIMKHYAGTLQELFETPIESGQKVSLIDTGNISKGAYGVLPNKEETSKIDAKMKSLIDVVEGELDQKLPVHCYDIGITPEGKIVVFEFQVPFGMTGYLDLLPEDQRWGVNNQVLKILAGSE